MKRERVREHRVHAPPPSYLARAAMTRGRLRSGAVLNNALDEYIACLQSFRHDLFNKASNASRNSITHSGWSCIAYIEYYEIIKCKGTFKILILYTLIKWNNMIRVIPTNEIEIIICKCTSTFKSQYIIRIKVLVFLIVYKNTTQDCITLWSIRDCFFLQCKIDNAFYSLICSI